MINDILKDSAREEARTVRGANAHDYDPLQRTLITGITGNLGFLIASQILKNGGKVHAIVRNLTEERQKEIRRDLAEEIGDPSTDLNGHLTLLNGDITRLGSEIHAELAGKFDTVLHCAADLNLSNTNFRRTFETNYGGTLNVISLARNAGCSLFVYFSTGYVWGKSERPYSEELPNGNIEFNNYYELSKYYTEEAVAGHLRSTDIKHIVIRPSIVCGKYTDGSGLEDQGFAKLVRMVDELKKLNHKSEINKIFMPGNGDGNANLIPIDIAVDSILKIVRSPDSPGKTFHVFNPNPLNNQRVLDVICDELQCTQMELVDVKDGNPAIKYLEDLYLKRSKMGKYLVNWLKLFRPYTDRKLVYDMTNVRAVIPDSSPLFNFDSELSVRAVCRNFLKSVNGNRAKSRSALGQQDHASEHRVILDALRGRRIELAAGKELDWPYLFDAMKYHKITSLVFSRIEGQGLEKQLPTDVRSRFADHVVKDRALNEKIYDTARILHEAERELKIKVVYLKGFILKHFVYERPELRPMDDIDILVAKEDLFAIQDFLKNRGFYDVNHVSSRIETQLKYFYELPPLIDAEKNEIDIHWHYTGTASRFYRDLEQFFTNTIRVRIKDFEVSSLDTEFFLLLILLHLYISNKLQMKLRDFYDIQSLIERGIDRKIDLNRFFSLVGKLKLHDPVYFGLKLTHDIFQTEDIAGLLGKMLPYVGDAVKQEARDVIDNRDILIRPGNKYISEFEDLFYAFIADDSSTIPGTKFMNLMKKMLLIKEEEYEKLYFEKIDDSTDTMLMFLSHPVRLYQYYKLSFGSDLNKFIENNVLDKVNFPALSTSEVVFKILKEVDGLRRKDL